MTAAELIEHLTKINLNTEIVVTGRETQCYAIAEVGMGSCFEGDFAFDDDVNDEDRFTYKVFIIRGK